MINYILIRAVVVSATEYDVNIDTDLPEDVVKKLIKEVADSIDNANVTDVGESQSTVPEDYN